MSIFKRLKAVRGAVCCEDTEESISEAVKNLYEIILKKNFLFEKDIVSIQFTVTDDIKSLNPAAALRKKGFAESVPLFCSAEPCVKGSLPKTIRILIYFYSRIRPFHVYIGGAEVLRPDLAGNTDK
ncbi:MULTISPECIES: chorismate mutase [unclassified Treponema]|uniref:chorismate mutase n=1 Tax=unclassified Treponema TaxID=2638727 RepID=UPI0020A58295|nr:MULTISPECIES: chorismate mutase [unclassified Treponema]UTC68119.1 chorismate mutase [Treponema sp. OMZ 789]UTC70841.1 chorismate mutase [Treponema sp. OMZ 790]UTC73581.1 chorismate mutase [Treponema sp. OMZ 791]